MTDLKIVLLPVVILHVMVDGIFTKSRMLTLAILAVVPTGTGLQPRYLCDKFKS